MKRDSARVLLLALLSGLALGSCRPTTPAPDTVPHSTPDTTGPAPAPAPERDTSVKVPEEDTRALVDGNTAFAWELYHELATEPGNVFLSPYSVSLALAMTYGGARGETESEMAKVLHFTLPQDRLHAAFASLDARLQPSGGREIHGFRLKSANSLWVQAGYALLPAFTELVTKRYAAEAAELDFRSDPDAAADEINEWVKGKTEKRITGLIPPGSLTPDTRLVLANAVHFIGKWHHQFGKSLTQPGSFTRLDGEQVEAQMMHQETDLDYAEGDTWQAVSLPYELGGCDMVIVLPRAGRFAEVEEMLTGPGFSSLVGKIKSRKVRLTMPRFTFTCPYRLNDTLIALGMGSAFGDTADFSGMSSEPGLFITEVRHKAFVRVDEEGTEAAAATEVGMAGAAPPMPKPEEPVEFTADRPFVFLIRDRHSGAVLFVGRVMDPTTE